MTSFLLQLSLGPVQGFIATARRSRDLWFGSFILSEISKAAAKSLLAAKAELIFPAPQAPGDLDPYPRSDFTVANVVTAELSAGDMATVRSVLEDAKKAAEIRWEELCAEASKLIDGVSTNANVPLTRAAAFLRKDVWTAQLSDVVEVVQAAVPLSGSYEEANKKLRNLVANRKNTRDFAPYKDDFNLPKSSLDGAQSTVLNSQDEYVPARLRLGIETREQLDTAGTVKRVVGRARGFVPAARVAAAPWIDEAKQHKEDFDKLKKAFESLVRSDLATRLDDRYTQYPWIEPFPFDGQLLYPERIDAEYAKRLEGIARNRADTDSRKKELAKDIENLRKALTPLIKKCGTPPAYYGLLLADGDRMGKLIDRAAGHATHGAQAHRNVSSALSRFASGVPDVMSRHGGACIYSGGDDVLGLVCLPQAIECARALADSFTTCLQAVNEENGLDVADRPTLSVGIAIVHMLEPLGDVRVLASDAEKLAKGSQLANAAAQRNALALIAKPRGGDRYECRVRWDDDTGLRLLEEWQSALRRRTLPRGLPHELDAAWRRADRIFAHKKDAHASDFAQLWRAFVGTILKKKRSETDEPLSEEARLSLLEQICVEDADPAIGNVKSRARLDMLLAALWLSGHIEAAAA